MDFLHAVAAAGLGQTWAAGVIHDDGTPVKVGENRVEFFGKLDPDVELVGEFCFEEVDAARAQAFADSVNALLGDGMAEPWQPDQDSPPASPGTPRQRLSTLKARRLETLDERTPAVIGGTFHKGQWKGLLDNFLPDGYRYTAKDAFVAQFLKQFRDAAFGTSTAPGAKVALVATDVTELPTSGIFAGQAFHRTGDDSYWIYSGMGMNRVDKFGDPIVAPTAGVVLASGQPAAQTSAPAAAAVNADAHTLSLHGGQFFVSMTWETKDGQSGLATVVPGASDTSGLFWFFDASNWEVGVKVIDGRGANGHWWVFAAGWTDLRVDITVTEVKAGTQVTRTYRNQQGVAFAPIQDTSAFPA